MTFVIGLRGTSLPGFAGLPKIISWTAPRTPRPGNRCFWDNNLPMAETPKRVERQEIARRVERGEKLLQKGKPGEALEEFLQTLALDPSNDTVRQMAADLCLSLQRPTDATRLLGELFEHQMAAGDGIRASLTYKKLARFATPTGEQKLRFAELLEKSNRKLALETYESVLAELSKQGRKAEALLALKKMVALDGSERNLVRLGEAASESGDGKQAAAAFLKLAQQAESSNADPSEWYQRAYSEDATDETIAMGYAKCLMQQQQVGAAIFVLEPLASAGKATPEFRDLYSRALLSANRLTEAAPLVWQIFELNPSRIEQVRDLIGAFLDSQLDREAVTMAEKLEHFQRRKGERRAFLAMMQDIVAGHRPSVDMLEFLADQFNAANREADYCTTLLKLFDSYCAQGNYTKAAEALDRAAEIDAYEPGHQKRLEQLKGRIDDARFNLIASRFTGATPSAPVRNEEKTLGAGTLQDLMVQAEILVQYGMRNKALERLQRIQQLFPHEEERNLELHQLYMTAGMMPQYATSQTPASLPVPSAVSVAATPVEDVSGFSRIPEITRKLNRESSAEAVLQTAATEIGTQWRVERCVLALRKPGLAVTAMKEYVGPGSKPGAPDLLRKLLSGLHDLVLGRGPVVYNELRSAAELMPLAPQLSALEVNSLVALPLSDSSNSLGVLVLAGRSAHAWPPNDLVVFKMIAEQVAVALSNAGLRRLVKNLSVTDENSGLLKRASYLDLLMGEVRRSRQQTTPLSVLLMSFGDPSEAKEPADATAESTMQRLGQLVAANVRQNDLAFRYASHTIALVLGETAEKEGLLVVEKMRRLIATAMADKQLATSFDAGVAEAVLRQEFDPVDIVTELINRAEHALEKAVGDGPGKAVALATNLASAAVA
jgi:tetratricopeptide (TPR) repeat protein/GGDEF domain-containing protein